jgi:hypothetical protein
LSNSNSLSAERRTQCAPGLAAGRIREYFASLGSGETVHLKLHVRLHIPGVPAGFRMGRDVIARLRRYSDNDHIAEIEWDPRSRWLPYFNGIITVEPQEGNDCRLVLNGVYAPPMSWFGRFFDRVVGRRLAQTTASELLEQIGQKLESGSKP